MVDEGPIRTGVLPRPPALHPRCPGHRTQRGHQPLSRHGEVGCHQDRYGHSRDLTVFDPTRSEAEAAFNRIRNRKAFWDGIQQNPLPWTPPPPGLSAINDATS